MYCSKCGAEVLDEAVFCPKCGCVIDGKRVETVVEQKNQNKTGVSNLKLAAKILMIISTICSAWCLLPLAWMLPMTISYSNKIENKEEVSLAFKICTLLFVNTIAGILMLCDNEK